jgi:hypothetical protein
MAYSDFYEFNCLEKYIEQISAHSFQCFSEMWDQFFNRFASLHHGWNIKTNSLKDDLFEWQWRNLLDLKSQNSSDCPHHKSSNRQLNRNWIKNQNYLYFPFLLPKILQKVLKYSVWRHYFQ